MPDPHAPEHRSFNVLELRALGDDEAPGTFEAIVSVFGNIDSYGDRMVQGAFERTLKPSPEGRGLPPIVWSHEWQTPPIGATLIATEEERGLYIKGRLLVDVANGEDHQVARMVWAAMRAQGGDNLPPLREFSFGFRTIGSREVTDEEDPAFREVTDVDLYEVGPTLVGANPATELIAVRSAVASAAQRGILPMEEARRLLEYEPKRTSDKSEANARAAEERKARIATLPEHPIPHAISGGRRS